MWRRLMNAPAVQNDLKYSDCTEYGTEYDFLGLQHTIFIVIVYTHEHIQF